MPPNAGFVTVAIELDRHVQGTPHTAVSALRARHQDKPRLTPPTKQPTATPIAMATSRDCQKARDSVARVNTMLAGIDTRKAMKKGAQYRLSLRRVFAMKR